MSFDPYTGKPTKPATAPWWKRNLWAIIACAVLLLFGIGVGVAAGRGDKTASGAVTVTTAGETVTVTDPTASPPETVTQTVAKTPPACENALEDMRKESVQMGAALKLAAVGDTGGATPHINAATRLIAKATPLYYKCNGLTPP
jgi:hypothetical protein